MGSIILWRSGTHVVGKQLWLAIPDSKCISELYLKTSSGFKLLEIHVIFVFESIQKTCLLLQFNSEHRKSLSLLLVRRGLH